jgi:hypothetical protein
VKQDLEPKEGTTLRSAVAVGPGALYGKVGAAEFSEVSIR